MSNSEAFQNSMKELAPLLGVKGYLNGPDGYSFSLPPWGIYLYLDQPKERVVSIDFMHAGLNLSEARTRADRKTFAFMRVLKTLVVNLKKMGYKLKFTPSDAQRDSLYGKILTRLGFTHLMSSSNALPNQIWASRRARMTRRLTEVLPGGLGDGQPDSAFDPQALKSGQQVELEHTSNKTLAKEIAKDHLTESPDYYKKLRKMERTAGTLEEQKRQMFQRGLYDYDGLLEVFRKDKTLKASTPEEYIAILDQHNLWTARPRDIPPDEDQFIEQHKTGHIPNDAYRTMFKDPWIVPNYQERYPILLETKNMKGVVVEFRQSGERLKYVKYTPEDEIVRDDQGMAVMQTEEEMRANGLHLTDTTVAAFVGNREVGCASDEWGADGVFVDPEFKRLGIGVHLLYLFRKQFKPERQMGQMTHAGEQLARAYYQKHGRQAGPLQGRLRIKLIADSEVWHLLDENPFWGVKPVGPRAQFVVDRDLYSQEFHYDQLIQDARPLWGLVQSFADEKPVTTVPGWKIISQGLQVYEHLIERLNNWFRNEPQVRLVKVWLSVGWVGFGQNSLDFYENKRMFGGGDNDGGGDDDGPPPNRTPPGPARGLEVPAPVFQLSASRSERLAQRLAGHQPFARPADIPEELAWGIYRVVHNQADADDWENFDRIPRKQMLQFVARLLQANGMRGQELEQELRWWENELFSRQARDN